MLYVEAVIPSSFFYTHHNSNPNNPGNPKNPDEPSVLDASLDRQM
jgi:hypothetical protein